MERSTEIILLAGGGVLAVLLLRKHLTNNVSTTATPTTGDYSSPSYSGLPDFSRNTNTTANLNGSLITEDVMQFNTYKTVGYQSAADGNKYKKPDFNKIQAAAVAKIGGIPYNDAITVQRNYLNSLGVNYDEDYVRTRAAVIGGGLVPITYTTGVVRLMDLLQLPVANGGLSNDYFIFS